METKTSRNQQPPMEKLEDLAWNAIMGVFTISVRLSNLWPSDLDSTSSTEGEEVSFPRTLGERFRGVPIKSESD